MATLLTGATGFLGKVVLEKLLRETNVKLYLLLRPANERNVEERLQDEVLGSTIFNRLRDALGDAQFAAMAARRVVAVRGDLALSDLGLSAVDRRTLAGAVVDVMHIASAHVRDSPRVAVRVNVLGTLQLLALAKEWKARAFAYASSAFVSAGRSVGSRVDERLYPLHLSSAAQREIVDAAARDDCPVHAHVGPLPDVGTLAMAIAECMVAEQRGDLPVAIIRPSMLGACLSSPVPGWIDSANGLSPMFVALAVGLLSQMPGHAHSIADIAPADLVANQFCAALELAAALGRAPTSFLVTHATTSSSPRPLRWRVVNYEVPRMIAQIKPRSTVFGPRFRMLAPGLSHQAWWWLNYSLPTVAAKALSGVGVGSEQYARDVEHAQWTAEAVIDEFKWFTTREWRFARARDATGALRRSATGPLCDLAIAWPHYMRLFAYGICKYLLGEDVVDVTPESIAFGLTELRVSADTTEAVEWEPSHYGVSLEGVLPDLAWVYGAYRPGGERSPVSRALDALRGKRAPPAAAAARGSGGDDENLDWYKGAFVDRAQTRSHEAMTQLVLSRPAVRDAVSKENFASKSGAPQRGRPRGAGAKARAAKLLEHLAADYNEGSSRAVGYLLRKVWRSMYSGIIINDVGVERVRALQLRRAEAGPMLMLPTHRSCVCTSLVSST